MRIGKQGDSWGHLEVVRVYREEVVEWQQNYYGQKYKIRDDWREPPIFVLRCRCGREFEKIEGIPGNYDWLKEREDMEFAGRRKVRNCGSAECPYAAELQQKKTDRQKVREQLGRPPSRRCSQAVAYTISVPIEFARQVAVWAEEQEIGISQAYLTLIQEGMEAPVPPKPERRRHGTGGLRRPVALYAAIGVVESIDAWAKRYGRSRNGAAVELAGIGMLMREDDDG